MFTPIRLSRSLGLAWALASQQLTALIQSLGLGPLAVRAFLPRAVCRALDDELKRLETLVRRVLFIAAMEAPLPRLRRVKPRTGPPPRPPSPPEGERDTPIFPVPAFRLTESARQPNPGPSVARTAPSPASDPADRPRPDDLIPSARLLNRLAALQDALADPEPQVARFRKKLARIRADKTMPLPVADTPPPACLRPDLPAIKRELFWKLHDAALSWLPILDSG
jgi:hypothetical protein